MRINTVNYGDPDASQKYKGIGFGVEDDFVFRENATPVVLTQVAVNQAKDIQQMVGSAIVKLLVTCFSNWILQFAESKIACYEGQGPNMDGPLISLVLKFTESEFLLELM